MIDTRRRNFESSTNTYEFISLIHFIGFVYVGIIAYPNTTYSNANYVTNNATIEYKFGDCEILIHEKDNKHIAEMRINNSKKLNDII